MMLDQFRKFTHNKNNLAIVLGVAVAFVGLVIVLVVVSQNFSQPNNSEQLQQIVENETEKLESEIGELEALPEETPILMTVTDKSQLTDEIFKDAEDGDKILIYEGAGLVIVYRESTGEIVAKGKVKTGSVGDENMVPTGVAE